MCNFPEQGLPPTTDQIHRHLRRSNEVAKRAVSIGHHPFGAVLVGPDQETVLMEQCNVDTVIMPRRCWRGLCICCSMR